MRKGSDRVARDDIIKLYNGKLLGSNFSLLSVYILESILPDIRCFGQGKRHSMQKTIYLRIGDDGPWVPC